MDLFSKKQSYAIRKLTVGTASVLVGCLLLSHQALAEEVARTDNPTETPAEQPAATSETVKPAPAETAVANPGNATTAMPTAPAETATPTTTETPAAPVETAAPTTTEAPATPTETTTPANNEGSQPTDGSEGTTVATERPRRELDMDEIANLYAADKVLERKDLSVDASNGQRINLDSELSKLKELTDATIHMEIKADGLSSNFRSLFSVSSSTHRDNYLTIYSNNGIIGVEGKNGNDKFYKLPTSSSNKLVDGEWNAVTVAFNTSQAEAKTLSVYVNGILAYQDDQSNKALKELQNVNHAQVGTTIRHNTKVWGSDFSLANLTVYKRALTAEEIAQRAGIFKRETYPERLTSDMVISDRVTVFESGKNNQRAKDGIYSYRIPSLLTTDKGTVIAVGDARETHSADWGNVGISLHRSTDQGKTWGDRIDVINIRDNPKPANKSQQSPVTMDAGIVQDPTTKRIFVIYDMFLEGQAIHSLPAQYETAYEKVGDKTYRVIYKDQETGHYTVREDGKVYTPEGQATNYRVVDKPTTAIKSDIGDIYENDKLIGNIFFTTNKTSPFRAARASYLWMQHSDDDGLTWSNPVDLTPMVSTDKMKFHGVGPGAGIVLHTGQHKGRIIIPTYSTNFPGHLQSQSSRVIYSDDHGETWKVGKSPNDGRVLSDGTTIHTDTFKNSAAQNTESTVLQLDNGQLKLFMRNLNGRVQVTTSTNGGETWGPVETIPEVVDVYVQLSAIHTHHNGKEYIILSNANGPGRNNGYLRVAEVQENGSFKWLNHKLLQKGSYAYNSLAKISEDNYGILYEHSDPGYNDYSLHFKRFNLAYALAQTEPIAQVTKIDKLDKHHVRLQFDKPVWARQAEHLQVENGGLAYFTSQESPTTLIYAIREDDWGKALVPHTARHIINVNKVDVLISGQLPEATASNQNDYDILRRLNDVTAKRVGYNKALISYENLGAGATYVIERHNLDTKEVQFFQTTEASYLDQTIRSGDRYTYYARGEGMGDIRAKSFGSTVLPQARLLDDRDPSIRYGRAFGDYRDTRLYGQSEKFADITGNTTYSEADITATIPFVGKGIEIYGLKHSSLSFAKVRIDGKDMGTIDFNKNGNANGGELIKRFDDLEDGAHSLELIVNNQPTTRTNERNKISLDYFRILSADPTEPEVLDDQDKRIKYGSAYHDYPDSALYGGKEKYADINENPNTPAADATLTLEFEGTGIQVYGNRNAGVGQGIVTIDGVQKAPLVFYKAGNQGEKGVLIGEYRGLENKKHTLTIRVDPNTTAGRKKVSLDAFVILHDNPVENTSPLVFEVTEKETDILIYPPSTPWTNMTLSLEGVDPIILTPATENGIPTNNGTPLAAYKENGLFILPLPTGFNRDKLSVAKIKATGPLGESNENQAYIRPIPLAEDRILSDAEKDVHVVIKAGDSRAITGLRITHLEPSSQNTPTSLSQLDFDLYDIVTIDKDGKPFPISRPAGVVLPIDADKTVEKVIYLPENAAPQELTFVQKAAENKKNYVAFTAEHFSHYAIVYKQSSAVGTSTTAEDLPSYTGEISTVGTSLMAEEKPNHNQEMSMVGTGLVAEELPVYTGEIATAGQALIAEELPIATEATAMPLMAEDKPVFMDKVGSSLMTEEKPKHDQEMSMVGTGLVAEELPVYTGEIATAGQALIAEELPIAMEATGTAVMTEDKPVYQPMVSKTDEPKKDSQAADKSEDKKTLPSTGDVGAASFVAMGLLTGLAGLSLVKSKRED